jgi:NitT/TauT family transport system ATP-binding protein
VDIEFDTVGKSYTTRGGGEIRALEGVSASIPSGSFVSLVGPSGCGKTTLLDMLLGVHEPSSGRILLDGRPRDSAHERPGVVLQAPTLLPWRTVRSNVLLPAECGPRPAGRGAGRRALEARAQSLLELVHIGDFGSRYPWELSGGMQQRVAIARALLLKSSLMCFDEPFSALDEFTRESLNTELQRVWMQEHFTAVFVTHNIQEAVLLSDRVLVMAPRPGRVIADVEIDLPRPRGIEELANPAFGEYVLEIRDALRSVMEAAA